MGVRLLVLGLVAGSLSACGVSSLNDVGPVTGSAGASLGAEAASGPEDAPQVASYTATRDTSDPAVQTKAKRELRAIAERAAEANQAGVSGYKIGPQDVLDITVFKVPDLSKTLQVSEAGTINYPLIGETAASGKTAREFEQDLTRKLGANYLQNPQVTVLVKEYNSQRVTIEGAVKKPGIYPLQGGMTLLQLVATAQGLDEKIAEDDVVILRDERGKRQAARFALSQLRAGNGKDPVLEAGDVVIVNTSATKQAFNTVMQAMPLARFFLLF